MKKMRKLIPALAMLLVSAVMMSTASFAWFSMNTTVEANGMVIKATSSGGLVIAVSDVKMTNANLPGADAYSTTVDFNWTNGSKVIAPTSNHNGTWYTATAADPTSHAATSWTTVDTAATETKDGKGSFLWTQCAVKTLGETDGTLYLDAVTITGANTSAALDKSLRVAVEVGGTWYYFAPKRTAAPTETSGYKCSSATGPVEYTVVSSTNGTGEFTNTNIGTLDAADATQVATLVNIYVYFEGEDPECKSVNVQTLVDLTINVKFSSVA